MRRSNNLLEWGHHVVRAVLPWKKAAVIPDGNISVGFAVVLLTPFACTHLPQLAFVLLSSAALKSCSRLAQYS